MGNAARFTGFLVAVAALAVSVWAFPQTAASALQSPSLLSAASVAAPGNYESSDPCVTYSGVWTLDNAAASASGGEIHYSAAAGSYVAMEFEGDAVTLVTAKGPAEGMARVTIDDVLVGDIDLYRSGDKLWQVPFRYTAQLAGRHVLKVALRGTKNLLSTGYNVVIDAFVVEGPAATASSTATTTPTTTPASTVIPSTTPALTATATPTFTPAATLTGTPSATATPTAAATQTARVRVEARVGFQRPAGAAPSSRQQPLTMWVYSAGGWNAVRQGVILTASAVTSSDGVGLFTLEGLAPGGYDLQLKGVHTLSRLVARVSLVDGTNAVQFGTLSEGDVNGDDEVSGADFQFVATRFGLRSGESGFDTVADLTGDGLIDVADLSLLAANYGARGPVQ